MLSHPLKLVWLSGNLRSLALFWADWSSTIWLNAGCLPWILVCFKDSSFFFFPRRKHYLDCYAVCRGDFPLGSCLRCGQITQSCTRLFFFRPHKYIFTNTPLSALRSPPFVFSSQIVCFHAWAEKWEHPRGELALIHLRETGAKAEKASLNAVMSTVPVSKSLALCVLRFTLLWFNNIFTLCSQWQRFEWWKVIKFHWELERQQSLVVQ